MIPWSAPRTSLPIAAALPHSKIRVSLTNHLKVDLTHPFPNLKNFASKLLSRKKLIELSHRSIHTHFFRSCKESCVDEAISS